MISLGFIVGIIFSILVVLGCFAAIIYGLTHNDAYEEGGFIAWMGVGALFVYIPLAAWGFFPYSMEYHSYRPVEGKVQAIDKRQVSKGESFEEKFAVRFEGSDQIYGCEDTRCAVAKPGDKMKLNCIKVWQYASEHGYDCRYAQ